MPAFAHCSGLEADSMSLGSPLPPANPTRLRSPRQWQHNREELRPVSGCYDSLATETERKEFSGAGLLARYARCLRLER